MRSSVTIAKSRKARLCLSFLRVSIELIGKNLKQATATLCGWWRIRAVGFADNGLN